MTTLEQLQSLVGQRVTVTKVVPRVHPNVGEAPLKFGNRVSGTLVFVGESVRGATLTVGRMPVLLRDVLRVEAT